jgi:glycosyltransferase involved in cell wall biosynthesis
MKPTISVIIPVYNRGWQLKRALHSLVTQTDKDFEVIVCDDGSIEDIQSVLSPYANQLQLSYIKIENSGGPARPRNKAASQAKGTWLSFLDSDDWWDSHRISNVKLALNKDVDLLYHPMSVVREKGIIAPREKRRVIGNKIRGDVLKHMLFYGNPIPNSAAILRQSYFKKINGFVEDSKIASLEDFDAWLRVAESGGRIKFLNKILGYYWVGNDSISSISRDQVLKHKELFARHINYVPQNIIQNVLAVNRLTIATLLLQIGRESKSDAKAMLLSANPLPSLFHQLKRLIKLLQCYLPY